MNISDKKKEIIQAVQSSDDEQLIEDVYDLLNRADAVENISLSILPIELENKIARALEDYKKGNYITHQQMKEKVDQWLTN